jgi:lipopolysaccharide biosynthesis protein
MESNRQVILRLHAVLLETRQALAARDAALGAVEAERRAIVTSWSWRLTRPLRGIAGLLSRVRSNPAVGGTPIETVVAPDPAPPPPPEPVAATESVPAQAPFPDLFALKSHQPTARLAVVVHVFYPDLALPILETLANIPEPFDLYISLVLGHSDHIAKNIETRFPAARLLVFPNHGRDICPFVLLVNTGVLCRYAVVLKLHTKKSPHRSDGHAWRQTLIDEIAGSPERVRAILARFARDPDCGAVVAAGNIVDYVGSNHSDLHHLMSRLDLTFAPDRLRFPAGSIYWVHPFALRLLQALRLTPDDFDPELGAVDGTMAHAVERVIGSIVTASGMELVDSDAIDADLPAAAAAEPRPAPRLVAFYLPQYHPIPENDRWWGKGFTEWTNVTRARPVFDGHYQPRLPADLGFYDLRVDAVREEQAALARMHGIDAFCYYYYWFDGRTLLDLPLRRMLETGQPDFPFCLCWANENWTRNWDGLQQDVLVRQPYGADWFVRFAHDTAHVMRDPRYLRVGGKPILVIYRIEDIPGYIEAIGALRRLWRDAGIGEVHLAGVRFQGNALPAAPAAVGLDAYVDFPPHCIRHDREFALENQLGPDFGGVIIEYDSAVKGDLERYAEPSAVPVHRGVMPAWDNTARRGMNAAILRGACPARFRYWLRGILRQEAARPGDDERLVFVNAWNEWAEGTYLEPDQRYGRAWLEAVRSARFGTPAGVNGSSPSAG